MKFPFLILLMVAGHLSMSQTPQNVGIGTTTPAPSAKLDVSSTNSGLLLPRMTTAQRNAIGAPALGLLVFDTDKSSLMFYDGTAWRALSFTDENKTLPQARGNSDASANAYFGTRVAISGNYAVIGASRSSPNGATNRGAAYVFIKGTSGWRQMTKLEAWDGEAYDYFGGSVAISGEYVAIGSCAKKIGGNNAVGKVYLYRRTGATWVSDSSILRQSGLANEYFGFSVGLSATAAGGPSLVVGAPYADGAGADAGSVQCFRRTAAGWQFLQALTPADLGPSDNFGQSIAMYGDYAVVGAPLQDNATYAYADAGAAYVYVFGGGVWNFQQKLTGSTARGQFGLAIAIYNDKLAIGAPWAVTYSNTSSSVFTYKRTGAEWTSTGDLYIFNFEVVPGASQINSNSTTTNKSISIASITFGMALAMDETNLLIGASGGLDYPNGGGSFYSDTPGSVYFYKNMSGDSYTQLQIIKSEFPFGADLFGMSVGLSEGKYVISNARATVDNFYRAGTVSFGTVSP